MNGAMGRGKRRLPADADRPRCHQVTLEVFLQQLDMHPTLPLPSRDSVFFGNLCQLSGVLSVSDARRARTYPHLQRRHT